MFDDSLDDLLGNSDNLLSDKNQLDLDSAFDFNKNPEDLLYDFFWEFYFQEGKGASNKH